MSFAIYFLLICSMFAVSTSPLIARYLSHLDPIAISFWRMFIGAAILHIYGFFSNGPKIISTQNSFKTIYAGILLGLHFAFFYGAISCPHLLNGRG